MTKDKFNKLLKKSSGKTIDDLYIEYINLNLSNKDLIEFINKNKIKKLEFYKNKMNNLIVDYVMDKCLDLDYFTDDNVCYLKNTVTFY